MNNKVHGAGCTDFLVNKSDFRQQEFRHRDESPELLQGQVRLVVDRFALTANNITYAVVGEAMRYWDFFPTDENGMGRVPVWGFARVSESNRSEIGVGERIYGFLPMSTEFVVAPDRISDGGFVDGMTHRQELHQVYNQYTRVNGDPTYVQELEAQQMILRPLFMTSFLIEDFLGDSDYFGAERVILTSASSKTAIGLAYQIANSDKRPAELIGLTSVRNQAFVAGLDLYDTVVTYDNLENLDPETASVLVDMAGNGDVLQRLHEQLNDELMYSCRVGASHWDANAAPSELAGPKPQWFFAPAQFQKRASESGVSEVLKEFAVAWGGFVGSTGDWMEVVESAGEGAIQQTFNQILDGAAPPSKAFIVSF